METNNWTKTNIPNLSGKTIIVTGGNSGLGYEAVKAFSEKNAEVILACRSIEKGEKAKKEMLEKNSSAKIEVMKLDLMDLASIKEFVENFKSKYSKLDILVNNAGIMLVPYALTKDGFESQIGTNHLGHFALTALLFDVIKNTPKSRIVTVSSIAHKRGTMDFNNFLYENGKGYVSMKAYGRSKLSNLLFTYELQRRLEKNGLETIAVAAHPGVSNTNLAKHLEKKFIFKLLRPLLSVMTQSAEMGALPEIRAAVDPNVKGAEFYGPEKERKGFPIVVESNELSHNEADAKKLWEMSEKLTGIKFLD